MRATHVYLVHQDNLRAQRNARHSTKYGINEWILEELKESNSCQQKGR